MGVSYIPPWGADLGKSLGEIGGAINNIIDPNFQFKRRFEQELMTNPELVQQIADLELNSPGFTNSIADRLSPASRSVLSAARPSLDARVANAISREVGEGITPDMARAALTRKTTGQSPTDFAISQRQQQSVERYGDQAVREGGVDAAESLIFPLTQRLQSSRQIAELRVRAAQEMAAGRFANAMALQDHAAELGLGRANYMQGQRDLRREDSYASFWSAAIPSIPSDIWSSVRTGYRWDNGQQTPEVFPKQLADQYRRMQSEYLYNNSSGDIRASMTQLRTAAASYRAARASNADRIAALESIRAAIREVNSSRNQALLPSIPIEVTTVNPVGPAGPRLVFRVGRNEVNLDGLASLATPTPADFDSAVSNMGRLSAGQVGTPTQELTEEEEPASDTTPRTPRPRARPYTVQGLAISFRRNANTATYTEDQLKQVITQMYKLSPAQADSVISAYKTAGGTLRAQ